MFKVVLQPISFQDVWNCFSPNREHKFHYFGAYWNVFDEHKEKECYDLLEEFFEFVDSKANPKWCPRWVLNLLHLFGNDNSIVRVRNWTLHNLFNKLVKGIRIHDVKTKYNSMRIYGSFTNEIWIKCDEVCEKINKLLEQEENGNSF